MTHAIDPAVVERAAEADLRAALEWVDHIYPGKNRDSGGAIVHMTWDEWNSLRKALGLREQPIPTRSSQTVRLINARAALSIPEAGEEAVRAEREALKLAVAMLALAEPGDSRAVSDEFVALAAISCGLGTPEIAAVVTNALAAIRARTKDNANG